MSEAKEKPEETAEEKQEKELQKRASMKEAGKVVRRFPKVLFINIFFMVGTCLMEGALLRLSWGWFVVPVFDVPAIPLASAVGISILVIYLTQGPLEEEIDLAAKFSKQLKQIWKGMKLRLKKYTVSGVTMLLASYITTFFL